MSYSLRVKRLLAGSAAMAMAFAVLPAGVAAADTEEVCAGSNENQFDDVAETNTHAALIDCLASYGITTGVTADTYEPGQAVTRQQMALFIARFIQTAEDCDTTIPDDEDNEFNDISGLNPEEANDAINYLHDIEVVEGVTATEYRPGDLVTRGQMASFIARALDHLGVDLPQNAPDAFEDDDNTTHEPRIDQLAELQIVAGFNDGTYGPGLSVTRQQMASFIMGAAGAADEAEVWNCTLLDENVAVDADGQTATAGDEVIVTFTGNTAEIDTITVSGDCVEDGEFTLSADDTISVPIDETATAGDCELTFVVTYADGTTQTIVAVITVEAVPAPTTNQSFAVTPAEAVVVDEGEQNDFAVTGIDADEVVIALVECDDVTNSDGTVSFEGNTVDEGTVDEQFVADFGDVAADIIDVNGTLITSPSNLVVAPAEDGEVSFTVQGETDVQECYIAVVFEDVDGDELLDIDADGQPTEPFGIGGAVTLATISGLDASPNSALNTFGEQHTVTAQLQTDDDVDADGDLDPAPYAGEEIVFQVSRGNTVVATTVATTDADGAASFTYTVNDPDADADNIIEDTIVAWHDADGDRVNDVTEFDDTVTKTWTDAAAEATAFEVAPDVDFNEVGTVHTVTATVTDQFGDPIADEDVTFVIDRDFADTTTTDTTQTVVRTTNASGVATLSYTGPAESATDTVTATVTELGSESVIKYWVEEGAVAVTDAGVLGSDTDTDVIYVADTNDLFVYDYSTGELYTVNGAPATAAQFEAAVAAADADDDLDVAGYGDADVVTTFNLDTDTTAPAPASLDQSDETVNADTYTVSGTAEEGSTVTVTDGTDTWTDEATDGTFSVTDPALAQDTDTTYTVTVTDAAGNESAAVTLVITEDSTAPQVTADSSTATTDTITVAGTATEDDVVDCSTTDGTAGTGIVDGNGDYTCTVTGLTAGTAYTVTVTADDDAGNTATATITETTTA